MTAARPVRTRRPLRSGTRVAGGCGIAVMAKASAPGRTKTRLVPPLTFDEAAVLNTAFLQDIAANLLAAGRSAAIQGYMAFGPPGSDAFFHRHLPPTIDLIDCWLPNFGDCLLVAIEQILRRGHHAAVVLNADSPTLPTALLVRTAEILAQPGDHAVLGPASDGGYYLLGLKAAHRRLFEDIDWSTERVAHQTLQRASELGLPVFTLPTWYDVDDRTTLCTLHDEIRAGHAFDPRLRPNQPPQTAQLLDRLIQQANLALRLGLPQASPIERIAV
jgi:rSAM/selenodomain-associated transferase 1